MNKKYKQKIDKKRIEQLRGKIEERLTGENLVDQTVTLNGRELRDMLKDAITIYNELLGSRVEKNVKVLNRMIATKRLFNKKIPYIYSITPTIYEHGKEELTITFVIDDSCVGLAIIEKDMTIRFDFLKNNLSQRDTVELLKKNYMYFLMCFNALDSFRLDYPGIFYEWGPSSHPINNEQILDDGFIRIHYDLNNIDGVHATLYSDEDLETSKIKTREYGRLYDYIDYYNDCILESFNVHEESLNPLYKQIVDKRRKEIEKNKDTENVLRLK